MSNWLGRDVAWWWNYPCNDNDMDKLFMLDTYRNFDDEQHIDRNARWSPTAGREDAHQQSHAAGGGQQGGTLWRGRLWLEKTVRLRQRAVMDGIAPRRLWQPLAAGCRLLPNISTYDRSTTLADRIRAYKGQAHVQNIAPRPCWRNLPAWVPPTDSLRTMALSTSESDRLLWHDIQPFVDKLGDYVPLCRTNGRRAVGR